jgi:endonuclease/exonuclease/phosphatase family metal-dependent hydrolase
MKIMTLNLNFYESKHGPWPLRRELIADAIRACRPDVIAFQAVRKDPSVESRKDQATQLAERLPEYPHVVFQPTGDLSDGKQDGSAFLARIALTDVGFQPLKRGTDRPGESPDPAPRIVLYARIASSSLSLFNSHYSWVDSQAASNVEDALAYMNRFTGPRLLLGDLNTTPDTDAMHRLTAEGWTDAWAALRPGEDGYTFESDKPEKRIDYAWASRELRPYLKAVELVLEKPNRHAARLSDHLGLLIMLDDPSGHSTRRFR